MSKRYPLPFEEEKKLYRAHKLVAVEEGIDVSSSEFMQETATTVVKELLDIAREDSSKFFSAAFNQDVAQIYRQTAFTLELGHFSTSYFIEDPILFDYLLKKEISDYSTVKEFMRNNHMEMFDLKNRKIYVNSFHIRRPNEAVLTYLIFYCPKLNNLSAGVFRGFDGIYIVDIDESMDYQQKKAQIKVNNPSITYDYLDLGFNLIDYLDYYLDAWDYGTPRNIEKKAIDHDAENVVVKADKSVLDKALTIKHDE